MNKGNSQRKQKSFSISLESGLQTYMESLASHAYIYGSPLVGMFELLYDQVLNPATKTTGFNEFAHTSTLASAKTSFIPAPNNDTVYSRAWLDLRQEPVIIEVPDTAGRYSTVHLLNFFSETLANIGKRVNGTKAGRFAVVGPGWQGDLPKGIEVIHSDTTIVLAFLRILVNNQADLPEVQALQKKFFLASLSRWQKQLTGADEPSLQGWPEYKNSTAVEFFETLNQLLKLTPVLEGETGVLAGFKRIGIGSEWKETALKNTPVAVLEKGIAVGKAAVEATGIQFGEAVNFWRVARTGVGKYRYDYLQRAVVWSKGALANVPEESLYPSTFQDSKGQFLNGTNRYVLVFAKDQLPPVSQFWSLTMYIFRNGFLVDNPINRYSIGDRTPGLVYGPEGSLTIYIQHDSPGADKESNWLPAPAEKFYLTLRLYGPSPEVLQGKYDVPSVMRV